MARKALIVWGGWLGHEPEQVAAVFQRTLEKEGFSVEVSTTLASFDDAEALKKLHLIVPVWTMGKIERERSRNVSEAVANGTGLAGCHGGMCDAFRDDTEWEFMTGGSWVAHPGNDGTEYVINIKNSSSPLVQDIKDFKVKSEQYYMHVDPAVEVLATTRYPVAMGYHAANRAVDVPQVWTKRWALGRVYYNALGHHADIFDIPEALELMRRGFLWAADGKDIAIKSGLTAAAYAAKR